MGIGKRIAAIRRRKGWTQRELARNTKFSVGYIAAIEEGVTRPKIRTLVILAEALEVNLEELLKKY